MGLLCVLDFFSGRGSRVWGVTFASQIWVRLLIFKFGGSDLVVKLSG